MTIPIDYLWGIGFARQQGGGGDTAKIQALLDDAEERVAQLRNDMAWASFDSYNIGKEREKELRNQGNKRLRDQIVSGKASKYGRLDVEGWLEPYYQYGRAAGEGQFGLPAQAGIDLDIDNEPATKELVGLLATDIKERKLIPSANASARINEKLFRAYDVVDLIPDDKKLSIPYRAGYIMRGIKLSDHIKIYDLANVLNDPNYVAPEQDVFAGLGDPAEPDDDDDQADNDGVEDGDLDVPREELDIASDSEEEDLDAIGLLSAGMNDEELADFVPENEEQAALHRSILDASLVASDSD